MAVSQGIMDSGRTISASGISPDLKVRIAMFIGGWQLVAENPFGWGQVNYGTHSGFMKAAIDYGISYLILWIIAYGYLVRTSFFVSKKHPDFNQRIIAIGIMIAGIVGILQGIFGITMFTAGYAQVFWLFIAYIQLVKKKLDTIRLNSLY